MESVITISIIMGSIIMVGNIVAYIRFIQVSTEAMMGAKHGEALWQRIGLVLLIFFLLGYLGVAFAGHPDLLTAGILFFGAVFVTLALLLLYYLVDSLKTRNLEISRTLIGIIEKRDTNLNGHSLHVQRLAKLLYDYLPPQQKTGINPVSFEYAALLHDVGKLAVPEEVLNKPALLEPEEWKLMTEHPKNSVELLKDLPGIGEIKDWILYHHERVDGTGYYHIPGNEIPQEALMIAVCDTYSAVTMSRSYKAARTHEEAVQILKEAAGTQLDRDLVAIFLTIPKAEILACKPDSNGFLLE